MDSPNTLGGVKKLIRSYINRTDLSEELLETSISMALQSIQRNLRIPNMEMVATATLYKGADSLTIPGDYLELKNMFIDGTPVDRKSLDYISGLEDSFAGFPRFFARLQGEWKLYPKTDAEREVKIVYYGEFAPLDNDDSTNTILQVSPDLVMWGALGFLGEYFEDARASGWNDRMYKVMTDLHEQAYDQEYSGSILSINQTEEY